MILIRQVEEAQAGFHRLDHRLDAGAAPHRRGSRAGPRPRLMCQSNTGLRALFIMVHMGGARWVK